MGLGLDVSNWIRPMRTDRRGNKIVQVERVLAGDICHCAVSKLQQGWGEWKKRNPIVDMRISVVNALV